MTKKALHDAILRMNQRLVALEEINLLLLEHLKLKSFIEPEIPKKRVLLTEDAYKAKTACQGFTSPLGQYYNPNPFGII